MKRARVYFSDKNLLVANAAEDFVNDSVPAATIYYTRGLWNREVEYGLVVEILSTHDSANEETIQDAKVLALGLKERFAQESVLVTVEDVAEVEFV